MSPKPSEAVAIRMVDVRQPLQPLLDVAEYRRTRVFVLDDGELIGSVDVENACGSISAIRLRDAIASRLTHALMKRAVERQLETIEPKSLAADIRLSVVISTCNRPDDLRRCLAALQRECRSRPVEIVVVDNRPGPASSTPAVAKEFPDVVFVEEPRAGLSYGRNAGFAAATGEILVSIDDDVFVPEGWLDRLVAPFHRPEVAVVTGNVLPLEMETASQRLFEEYGGLGKGFERIDVNDTWFRSLRVAVPTWKLGATANAAFRASVLTEPAIGVLDEALGPGTPTGCGEDTYLFYRILKAGHTIVYEPTAWVWHRHRSEPASLRNQIYNYSKGHVAYHLTTLLRDGDTRALVRIGYSLPKMFAVRAYVRARGWSIYPLSLILLEIAGTLAGPLAFWRSRRRAKRLGPGARPKARHAVSLEDSLTQTPAA